MDALHNDALLEAIARMQKEDNRVNREAVLDLIIMEGQFLAPAEIQGDNVQFTLIQNQDGQVYFPAFTGWDELRKFCGPKNQQALALGFDQYAGMILKDNRAAGFVIDPFGCCLSFEREMVAHLVQRKANIAVPLFCPLFPFGFC
jgi:hypothetical protein